MAKVIMRNTVLTVVLFLLGVSSSYAIPASYGTATHNTTEWQELATYESGSLVSDNGVFWSVDGGITWGQETDLYVGQEVQFKFNMHKENVGTHYADFSKAWLDWGQDGSFDDADVIAYDYQELWTNESNNIGSYNEPNVPDYTFFSGLYTLTDDFIGDLYLRSRVTCSHSLAQSMGHYWWWDQWGLSESDYRDGFLATGLLDQGEVEEWKITVHTTQVPEPTTMFLLGIGLVGLAMTNRKKLKK